MDIEINGQQYRIGKLDARKQFHIARRLAPVMKSFGDVMIQQAAAAPAEGEDLLMKAMSPIIDAIALMSDEETDYILDTCLAVVSRQQPGGQYQKVMVGKNMLFADIDLPVMMQLTFNTIRENLSNFFFVPQAPQG